MRKNSSLLFAISLFSLLQFNSPVLAADQPDTATGGTSGSTDSNAGATLEGSVVEIPVTLNNLRDARLSISRVRKATANLYDEVTRQEVSMNFNPNVVGSTVIMMPTPSFTGQYLPPRKKWVDASMDEIGPIVKLFKEDVDLAIESNRRTNVDDKAKKSLDPIREDAFSLVKASFDSFSKLETLTAAPAYNSEAIASTANALDKNMKDLDKSLKKGISILQKEQKAQRKKSKRSA